MARILVVEDSPESMELMAYLLEVAGHSVRRAPTLARALSELRHVPLDVVVCDLNLKGASGLDLLRSLRSEPGLADIAVVAVTAAATRDLPQKARALGFDEFLPKPIAPRSFAREVERALERSVERTLSERRALHSDAQGLAG
jgi:CheY-like chemotaxis protein